MSNAQFAKDISHKGATNEQQMATNFKHARQQRNYISTRIPKNRKQNACSKELCSTDTEDESDEEMKQLQLELEEIKRQNKEDEKEILKKCIERERSKSIRINKQKIKMENSEFI